MFNTEDSLDDYMGQHRHCDDRRAHSTPEPDSPPPDPKPAPVPDDVPSPANAPVEEPTLPVSPIKAAPEPGNGPAQ